MTRTKALVAAIVVLFMLNVGTVVQVVRDVVAIQEQRTQGCRDQNGRHDDTLAKLNQLLMAAEGNATPAARARIRASEAPTVLLINALVPKRDCAHINDAPARR